MKHTWIVKPNKWFDIKSTSYRFYSMIALVTIGFGIEWLIKVPNSGMIIISLIGLYRISYFIIMDTKRLRQYTIKG